MTSVKTKNGRDAQYMALVRRFAIRPIDSEAEYDRALEIVRGLMLKSTRAALSGGEADYLAVLSEMVSKYEREHRAIDLSNVSGLDVLKHLMGERNMTSSDLGDVLHSRPLASMVLAGKRGISKDKALMLADYFGVDAGLFLR